jgi:hypothetical protein
MNQALEKFRAASAGLDAFLARAMLRPMDDADGPEATATRRGAWTPTRPLRPVRFSDGTRSGPGDMVMHRMLGGGLRQYRPMTPRERFDYDPLERQTAAN